MEQEVDKEPQAADNSLECTLLSFSIVDGGLLVQLKLCSRKNQSLKMIDDLLRCKKLMKIGVVGNISENSIPCKCKTCEKAWEDKGKQISLVLDVNSAESKCPDSCDARQSSVSDKTGYEETPCKSDSSTRRSTRIQTRNSDANYINKTVTGEMTTETNKQLNDEMMDLMSDTNNTVNLSDALSDFSSEEEVDSKLKGFKCSLCDKVFGSSNALEMHRKLHRSDKSPSHLSSYSKKTHGYKCRICGKVFKKSALLSTHIKTHGEDKVYSCSLCVKTFTVEAYLKKHLKRHTVADGSDPLSDSSRRRNYELRCKICSKGFSRPILLSTHMKTHSPDKKFPCSFCDKMFSVESYLKKHMKRHSMEKQIKSQKTSSESGPSAERSGYDCLVCGMNHITRAHLRKHMEDHTDEEQKGITMSMSRVRISRRCSQAKERYKTSIDQDKTDGSSEKTISEKHETEEEEEKLIKEKDGSISPDSKEILKLAQTENKLFQRNGEIKLSGKCDISETQSTNNTCKICNETFRTYFLLSKHMKRHGDKPFKCDICSESFRSHLDYTTHMKTHVCHLCSKTFETPDHLATHVASHQVLCKVCSEVFTLASLNQHMESHNRNVEQVKEGTHAKEANELSYDKSNENSEDNSTKAVVKEHDDIGSSATKPGWRHKCTICSKLFSRPKLLERHIETHRAEKTYECSKCDKTFTLEEYLKKHMKRHDEREKKQKGFIHGNNFVSKLKAEVQMKLKPREEKKERKKYMCEFCNIVLSSRGSLRFHCKRMHNVKNASSSFLCDKCGEAFSSQSNVDKHVETNCTFSETRKQRCKVCGKILANSPALELHMQYHTAERNIMCDICGKFFLKKSSLRAHMVSHTGYRPHACDICGRRYQHVWHMRNHRKVHTGENLLQCPDCKDWFVNPSYLNNQHRKKYCKGKRSFACDQCDKKFNDHKDLERHMGYHSGDRPFLCSYCGSAYPTKTGLDDHSKRHFLQPTFKCTFCDKWFKFKQDMKKHEARHGVRDGMHVSRCIMGVDKKPQPEPAEVIITEQELDQATVIIADASVQEGDQIRASNLLNVGETFIVENEDVLQSATFTDEVSGQHITVVLQEGMTEGSQQLNIIEDGQVLMVAMEPDSKL